MDYAHYPTLGCRRVRARAGEGARGSVSRVLSTGRGRMGDHSSRTALARGLQQSTRTTGRSSPCAVPIRSCSRWGLPCRSRYRARGALLPHPFDLARNPCGSVGRYAFCGTVPGVAPAGRYPAPSLLGARTFLPALRRGDRPILWHGGSIAFCVRRLKPRRGGRFRTRCRAARQKPQCGAKPVSTPVLSCRAKRSTRSALARL